MVLSAPSLFPSDNILSRFTTSGIGSRLGTELRPSHALIYQHLTFNQRYMTNILQASTSLHAIYDLAAAQCIELIAGLGWLRASEPFNLQMDDV